ncbi:hypothetical protein CBI38_36670 (plasmid) [Rhodococcus oxybenzonivorans]|uniref:Uncharacterized protein n=1 Tax=Rhodococcus oxybenzonivorans TaxID=1990687 RepID=A0A2S2C7X6_9NOCA|nr:hypothetical protein CBI38_36670 [Rhodococcus oxybenzonivorans]
MTAAGVDSEAVGARMSADLDQVPSRGAVRAPKKAPVPRKGKPWQSHTKRNEGAIRFGVTKPGRTLDKRKTEGHPTR